jgi:hypothetical protein
VYVRRKEYMKKIIPVIVVIAVIAIGAYSYLTGGKVTLNGNGFSVTKTLTSKSETFMGDLKSAVLKGVPFKCTFKTTQGTEGIGYMKNKQYYGTLTVDGKSGYIIMRDNCMWTWDKISKQGVKMCFEGDIWSTQGQASDSKSGDYTCVLDEKISDDLFQVPNDVKFIDADNPTETGE